MPLIFDPQDAAMIAAARDRRTAELRGLTPNLGPERAALVVRLLALSRAGVISGIWLRLGGVRVRQLPFTITIQWDRLAKWIERAEKP